MKLPKATGVGYFPFLFTCWLFIFIISQYNMWKGYEFTKEGHNAYEQAIHLMDSVQEVYDQSVEDRRYVDSILKIYQ